MKILYVSQYFPPEMGAPAARVSELARHWVRARHSVEVLTGFPNHPTGEVPKQYKAKLWRLILRERLDGVNVIRTWLLPLPNRKPLERILNYGSFCLSSCLTGIFRPRPDVVIATSPQLLVGLTGWWISKIKRMPFVLEVRDLWPESIEAVGLGRRRSLLMRLLGWIAGFLYRSCDHVVVVSPAFKDELVKKWKIPEEKISIVENGVETTRFAPGSPSEDLKRSIGISGEFVVSYVGTLGLAHGLNVVLQAALKLRYDFPNIMFLFIGEGAEKDRLIRLSEKLELRNVRFTQQQPRQNIPEFIRASDVCLVTLKAAEVFQTVIPTKMLEFMACGRPVVLGVDGEARDVLERARAGVFVEPENPSALADAITRLYRDRDLRETLGRNGRRYIVEHLSRDKTAQQYISVLETVIRNLARQRSSKRSLAGSPQS